MSDAKPKAKPALPKVRECPPSGTGCHSWLYHAACQFVDAGWPDEDAAPWIREHMSREPSPSDEVESALSAARREDKPESRKWPGRNWPLMQDVLHRPDWTPERPCAATEPTLRLLFPGDPLLCIGKSSYDFTTGRLSSFKFLDRNQFIVPNAMTEVWGKTKKGHKSMHALSNTGPRQYLVIEFDWGLLPNQMKLLYYLGTLMTPGKLVMVVSSGGKSAHGWWDFRGTTEQDQLRFFNKACEVGCDNRLWLRSQFCRMPGGTRDNGKEQSVLYFNPSLLRIAPQ